MVGLASPASAAEQRAAAPAAAALLGGSAINLTVPYTMQIARFIAGGPSSCSIWNEQGNATIDPVTWRCQLGDAADDDGFRFTNLPAGGYYVRFNSPSNPSAPYRWVANGKWTKIKDTHSAVCRWQSGEERYDAYCTVQ
ncbi:hypothetical protein Q0Z83_100930 [Actinoplanes sichuanensis]|nr:hypothetical protein Q0Z83_100930 [Actinoplanes sichuanensis]